MNEDTPEQPETTPEKSAEKQPRSRKRLPFGHGLIDATPPQPAPPAEKLSQLPLKEEAAKPSAPVAQEKKKVVPFGFGVLGSQPADDAEPETEVVAPEPPTPVERAPEADKDTFFKPAAFNILPFSDAPPPKHNARFGPEVLPKLEAYAAPAEEEEAAAEEPVAGEETIFPEFTAADAEPEETSVEPEETFVVPQEDDSDYNENVPDYFDEIVEYEIIEPPDDEEDDGFNNIPAGPMQEVRFDERPHRRSRNRHSRERARPQTRPRPASKPARQPTQPPASQTSTAKKERSPLQLAAIIAGAGIALALVVWLIVTLSGK